MLSRRGIRISARAPRIRLLSEDRPIRSTLAFVSEMRLLGFKKIFDTREDAWRQLRKRDYVRSERSSSRKLLDFSSRADVFIYSSSSIIAPRVRRTSLTVLVCLSVYNDGKE
jgi:hypothetical protein